MELGYYSIRLLMLMLPYGDWQFYGLGQRDDWPALEKAGLIVMDYDMSKAEFTERGKQLATVIKKLTEKLNGSIGNI